MKIGITGATGQLGRIAVAKLKMKVSAENLVALVRTPEKAADLGIERRPFDYTKPESLKVSLRGIEKLLFISGSEIGQRQAQHHNVIEAAKAAGVQEIVYTSLLHAETSSLSLASEHLATELALKASGISYTILRNGWYTENYVGTLTAGLESGTIVGSAAQGKIASATREDYAEAAAIVLTTAGHANKVYELAGDEAYTLADLASLASRQTGKEIRYQDLAEIEYSKVLMDIGLPETLAAAVASWDTAASAGDLFDDSQTLSTLLGRRTTPLEETVKAFLNG